MSFLKKLFGTAETEKTEKKMSRTEEIFQCLWENTAEKMVRFELKEGDADLLDSKIGGAFYNPQGMDIPVNQETGKELYLLAQLNFAQIPHLEDFPETGLLQIFIAGDDTVYGCDFDANNVQKAWRIRYLEEVPQGKHIPSRLIRDPKRQKDTYLPFEKGYEYRLKAKMEEQAVSVWDYRFEEDLKKYCPEFASSGKEGMSDEMWDSLSEKLQGYACQMGGYPFFTQWDPREQEDAETVPEVLLFQLDSVEEIMWGDSGVANFFITREALKAKDFSKVWYNWDCF